MIKVKPSLDVAIRLRYTLPETNSEFTTEHMPRAPKGNESSSSKHPFSGAKLLLVWGTGHIPWHTSKNTRNVIPGFLSSTVFSQTPPTNFVRKQDLIWSFHSLKNGDFWEVFWDVFFWWRSFMRRSPDINYQQYSHKSSRWWLSHPFEKCQSN